MPENRLQREILLEASDMGSRLFRNNVGKSWIGKSYVADKVELYQLQPGDVVISKARRFHAGLCEGSSDLIGWTPVDGKSIFTAVEVKTKNGRVSAKQKNFIEQVENSGGLAGVARCLDDLKQILKF